MYGDLTIFCLMSSYRRFEVSYCLLLQDKTKVKTLRRFETGKTTCQRKECPKPQDLSVLQHLCEDHKCRIR